MIDVADEEQVDRESASLPFLPPPPSGINVSNLYVMSTKDEKENLSEERQWSQIKIKQREKRRNLVLNLV